MIHVRTLAAALIALALVFAACNGDDDGPPAPTPGGDATPAPATATPAPPDRITFMPGFRPQANLPFVGAYVAQEMGFFAEENLEVEIQHVATPGDNFRFLALGEVQFSTADATALLERRTLDPVLPLVSVALIGQKGQQGFAVLADSGIESPADWAGKTAGYKGAQVTPDYRAILQAVGLDRSAVREVRVGFEPQILTEGQVDIFPVFLSNEPDTLGRLGYEVTVFEAADYGAPTLGLTYISSSEYVAENPDVVRRFIRAVLRGIEYADANREEAVDIVMQYAPQENRDHQRFMLDTELEAAKLGPSAEHGIGWQTLEQWQALYEFLLEHEALSAETSLDVADVFTNNFVEDAHNRR